MDGSVVSLWVAASAIVVGLLATISLARQRMRQVRAAQVRHPASTPPVSVSLVRDGRNAHLRLAVRSSADPTAVDIVSYRPSGTDAEWESAPIIEPVELGPDGWAILPTPVVGRAPSYEVVVAWTSHHPEGDRQGSGTFTVRDEAPAARPLPPVRRRGWVAAAVLIAALLIGAGTFVAIELLDRSSDEQVATSSGTAGATTVATTTPTTVTTVAATQAPVSPATTTPVTTTAATTTPVTTTPATTAMPAPSTAAPPASGAPTSTRPTTTTPDGPRVLATGRVEDCRFGPDCLVVGFVVDGFDTVPNEYVCEFGDGSRTTFRFGGLGAETACSQIGPAPSIVVEVGGIRSDPVTRETVT